MPNNHSLLDTDRGILTCIIYKELSRETSSTSQLDIIIIDNCISLDINLKTFCRSNLDLQLPRQYVQLTFKVSLGNLLLTQRYL